MTIEFALVVIRTVQVDNTVKFYRLLGVDFVQEKHGKGPEHFAGKVGGVVLEIYPLREGTASNPGGRFGFKVAKLEDLIKTLRSAGVAFIEEAKQTDWGYRAIVRDPDGRAVELQQI